MNKSLLTLAVASAFTMATFVAQAEDLEKAPLPIKTPIPAFMGTPTDVPDDPHLEKPSETPRAPFMAPKRVKNLALKKKVTGSDADPISGSYDLVTDGNKEFSDDTFLEMHRKTQWIQIDLGATYPIYAILIWHCHNTPQIYRDVVVLGSEDPTFEDPAKITTLYNNDHDNSSKLGAGKDLEYFENYEGRLIDTKGKKMRYIRCYSRGSTYSSMNRYMEVEAWGLEK